jgi:hypothetical protein
VLDTARQDVALHRSQRVLLAVDDQHLHALEDDAELLVLVAVDRHGGARFELDQVEHRALAENRSAGDTGCELELADVVEIDKLRLHGDDCRVPS